MKTLVEREGEQQPAGCSNSVADAYKPVVKRSLLQPQARMHTHTHTLCNISMLTLMSADDFVHKHIHVQAYVRIRSAMLTLQIGQAVSRSPHVAQVLCPQPNTMLLRCSQQTGQASRSSVAACAGEQQ